MTPPRWFQDARGREHDARWSRYGMLQHSHPWTDSLSPGQCAACREVVIKEVRLWR